MKGHKRITNVPDPGSAQKPDRIGKNRPVNAGKIPNVPAGRGTGSPIRDIAVKNAIENNRMWFLMGSPYLSTNETIVLSAHDLIINTVSAEAILTNQRLMLVDRTHPRILPQDIPFTAIETVTIGDESGNDPVLSLSIVTPDGTRQPLSMIFPQKPRTERTPERDEWAARIRELSITAQEETGVLAMELAPPWVPGPIPEEVITGEAEEVVPAGTRFKGPSLSERRSRAAGASKTRTIGIVAAILLIIAVVAVAFIFFYAPAFSPQTLPPATTPQPTPQMTMPPTAEPTAEPPTPAPETTGVTPTHVAGGVPQTGVWLQVKYDGSYTGTAGAPGRFRDIIGTGNQFFQLAVKDEIVSAAITKKDNSGNLLTVEFYNEGEMVKSASMTRPGGTLETSVNLKTS